MNEQRSKPRKRSSGDAATEEDQTVKRYEKHVHAAYRFRNGKRRIKWKDLPDKVRQCAIRDGKED